MGQRFAHVQRLELGERRLVLVHQVGQPVDQYRSLLDRQACPVRLLERFLPGRDGTVDIGRSPLGHRRQRRAVPGIDGLKRAAVGGLDPLAPDEHPDRALVQERFDFRESFS